MWAGFGSCAANLICTFCEIHVGCVCRQDRAVTVIELYLLNWFNVFMHIFGLLETKRHDLEPIVMLRRMDTYKFQLNTHDTVDILMNHEKMTQAILYYFGLLIESCQLSMYYYK